MFPEIKKSYTFIVLDDSLDLWVFLGSHGFGADDTCRAIEGCFESGLLIFFEFNLFFNLLIGFFFDWLLSFFGKNLFMYLAGRGSTAFGTHLILKFLCINSSILILSDLYLKPYLLSALINLIFCCL